MVDNELDKKTHAEILRAALLSDECIWYGRTRWLIESSRFMGELYEWQVVECGSDPVRGQSETEWRSHKIWDYDIHRMVRETREIYALKIRDRWNKYTEQ